MLNLILLCETCLHSEEVVAPSWYFTSDPITQSIYLASSTTVQCFIDGELSWTCPLTESGLLGIHFCAELESLLVVFSSGRSCRVQDGVAEEFRFLFENILAMEWSPAEDIAAIISQDTQLLLLNPIDGQLLDEIHLEVENQEVFCKQPVGVTWRGDGQFFAVSYWKSNQRVVAIFERDALKLHAMIQDKESLTEALGWQPNGRHLYLSASGLDSKPEIFLYESNGLAHGNFDLRSDSSKICSLKWNLDSQLLAVVLYDQSAWKLQIWKRSNWHWYLKQEKHFENGVSSVQVFWDVQEPLKLFTLTQTKSDFNLWSVCYGLKYTVSKNGTAGVIDGSHLNLTPLRCLEIPPPLHAAAVVFESAVQSFAFTATPQELIAVLLANKQVHLVECSHEDRWDEDLENLLHNQGQYDDEEDVFLRPQQKIDLQCCKGLETAHEVLWVQGTSLAIIGKVKKDQRYQDAIFVLCIKNITESTAVKPTVLEFNLLNALSLDNTLYLQDTNGCMYSFHDDGLFCTIKSDLSFPVACPHTLGLNTGPEKIIVGLSSNGKVYVGKIVVLEKVTSMIQREIQGSHFLLLTTKENKLHIRRAENLLETELVAVKKAAEVHQKEENHVPRTKTLISGTKHAKESLSVFQRKIEQGARLIVSPPGSTKVIFQMPRGNLETIQLRLFVLLEIVSALENSAYLKAWKLATENRVDLNSLIDYNPKKFLADVQIFLQAILSAEDVCDLMTALQQGSVFGKGGFYDGCLPLQSQLLTEEQTVENKITVVCSALRSAMIEVDSKKYSKAIVISFARMYPPQLEDALGFIKQLRLEELSNQQTEEQGSHLAGDTLKHLMLYVETSELYRVALSQYDLDLAYMVISHAQRDPGEYLNELQTFAEVDSESYRCALIDIHLHRPSSALKHLIAAGNDHLEEAIELAKDHHLFHELLSRLEGQKKEQTEVLVEYGHWLKNRGMMEDSGAAFLAANELQLAMESYQSSGEWRMAFILAQRLHLTSEELHELYLDTFDELKNMGKLIDASVVALEYLKNHEDSILLLTEARQWKEAVRLSYLYEKESLIERDITPAAAAAAQGFFAQFSKDKESIERYSKRLVEVRKKREAMEQTVGETGKQEVEEGLSTVGGLSLYTERTVLPSGRSTTPTSVLTKGGKKPQKSKKSRKKSLKIKQGSPEEEEALVLHLKELRPAEETLKEISELNEILISMGYFADARKLQSSLDTLIKTHQVVNVGENLIAMTGVNWKWDILRDI